ncbi:hypothetical protein ACWEK5_23470 [Rhodococcus koreensis]
MNEHSDRESIGGTIWFGYGISVALILVGAGLGALLGNIGLGIVLAVGVDSAFGSLHPRRARPVGQPFD